MIWKDQNVASTMATLTQKQRVAYTAFAIGSIFPILFLGVIRPVFWLAAFQLACATGLAYIRWRSPTIRGSLILVVVAAITCIASLVAGVAA